METAVNISQACNHFTSSMKLHFLTAQRDPDSCRQTLSSLLALLEGRDIDSDYNQNYYYLQTLDPKHTQFIHYQTPKLTEQDAFHITSPDKDRDQSDVAIETHSPKKATHFRMIRKSLQGSEINSRKGLPQSYKMCHII